jgi:hypothetical protein
MPFNVPAELAKLFKASVVAKTAATSLAVTSFSSVRSPVYSSI